MVFELGALENEGMFETSLTEKIATLTDFLEELYTCTSIDYLKDKEAFESKIVNVLGNINLIEILVEDNKDNISSDDYNLYTQLLLEIRKKAEKHIDEILFNK